MSRTLTYNARHARPKRRRHRDHLDTYLGRSLLFVWVALFVALLWLYGTFLAQIVR